MNQRRSDNEKVDKYVDKHKESWFRKCQVFQDNMEKYCLVTLIQEITMEY